jgi:hypothetical protein
VRAVIVVFVVIVATLLAGCPRTLSESDRAALQDFRTVERACLARAAEILRDESIHLSDEADLVRAIESDLVKPWQAMRARVNIDELKVSDELAAALRRYFDERELAWKALASSINADYYAIQSTPPVNHRWQYRDSTADAEKDKAVIDAKLAALKLPPLPPLAAAPIVDLDPPPAVTTPGAAYFLVGRSVVLLDDNGFRTIATDVDRMDVLPDGRMWACSTWHVAFWDGTKTTDYKPKIVSSVCAAGPDGELWVADDDLDDKGKDQLGMFDRTKWKIVTSSIGGPHDRVTQIAVDKDRRIYAYSGGVFVFDKGWRQLGMPNNTGYYNHLLRGNDGHVWATYDVKTNRGNPTGLARLTPAGGDEPVYLEDNTQSSVQFASIDTAGAYTVLDPRRNRLVQAKKTMVLPMPVARDFWERENPGPFSIDGAGRIWIDLVDGLNVIEKGGKRTIYPRGSIDGIHEEIRMIAVVGAGPKLVAPGPVVTRTIKGQLYNGGKLELAMCGDPLGRDCPPGLPTWKTTSDAEGAFTFENVPRWKMSIHGHVGLSGDKMWSILNAPCCAEATDLGEVSFHREAIY